MEIKKIEIKDYDYLSFCLVKNRWCEYIEGDLSFLFIIAGYSPDELTP